MRYILPPMDMDMDLALWRWTAAAQLVSAAITAVFFAVFARTIRTPSVLRWRTAWAWNLLAMVITACYWRWSPVSAATHSVMSALYIIGKGLFALQIVEGAWLIGGRTQPRWSYRSGIVGMLIFAVVGGLTLPNLPALGIVIQGAVAVILGFGAIHALRRPTEPVAWMGVGMAIRALFAGMESLVYASVAPTPYLTLPISNQMISRFLASSSSFDAVAEWLLALGCVLTAAARARGELTSTNAELLAAQEKLRQLVDVDSLTGLANRRSLPTALRSVQPDGAGVVFIDLRGFKEINDVRGHAAGDEALVRFASVLRESFRPQDHVIRYAGDEFVVVAPGLSQDAMMMRLTTVRAQLAASAGSTPPIEFDAGYAELTRGGMPDEAMRAADDAMYQAKQLARPTPLHLRAIPDPHASRAT
jgi:diguanylate cyclase (GGDEF)-like protein